MRVRKLSKSVAAIGLGLSLSLAMAPVAAAQGADIYGVGGGSVGIGDDAKPITFAFSAHTGPQGDFGSFKWTQGDVFIELELRVDITCVNVFPTPTGGAAWVQGPAKHVEPVPNVFGIDEGEELMFYVEDNGEPSDLVPDEIHGAFFGIPPQFCKSQTGGSGFPITQGNINIKFEE